MGVIRFAVLTVRCTPTLALPRRGGENRRSAMKKPFSILLIVAVVVVGGVAEAQPAKKVLRIGLLSGGRSSPMPPNTEAFRQGLRELGYVEGQNISSRVPVGRR